MGDPALPPALQPGLQPWAIAPPAMTDADAISRPASSGHAKPPSSSSAGGEKNNDPDDNAYGRHIHQDHLPSAPVRSGFPASAASLNASVVRKYDRRVMPFIFLGLLLFWLDRTSIALARINGLEADLRLHGAQFNIVNMVFVLSYIAFSIPGNLLLRRVGGARWLPSVVVAWGLVTVGTGFVADFASLCVTRVFLGIAEAGFMGSVLLYLGFFYTGDELTARVGIFFSSTPLAGSVGGLLAAGLGRIRHGRYRSWPWIFFVEGVLTVLLGAAAYFVLPDTPAVASFLTEEEKAVAVRRVRDRETWHFRQHVAVDGRDPEALSRQWTSAAAAAGTGTYGAGRGSAGEIAPHPPDRLEAASFRRAILHPMTLLMTAGAFFTICALFSYSLFLPTIVATLGYDGLRSTLMTVPPNLAGFLFTILATQWSQRTGRFAVPLMVSSAMGSAGYLMLLVGSTVGGAGPQGIFEAVGSPGPRRPELPLPGLQYAGTFFVAMGANALSPLAMAWISLNASPHYVRAISLGFIIMLGSFGGVVASFTYIKTQAPRYVTGHSINLSFLLATILVGAAVFSWMAFENKRRDRGMRDAILDPGHRGAVTREQYELQLGWRHPRFRYKM